MIEVDIENSWKKLLYKEFSKEYFKNLVAFVKQEYSTQQVYPKGVLIFNAFKYCELQNLKVIIIGQDPYHGYNQAHGLSFRGYRPPRPVRRHARPYRQAGRGKGRAD